MRTVVIYHNNCYDGFAAAWTLWQGLPNKDTKFIGANYGSEPPSLREDDTVFIVDFSYPRDVLEKINEQVAELHVYDHHKTAQANCEGLPFCVFDMNRSGAGITWDQFYGDKRPKLVDYVEDRDLWRFALPHSREVHAWLSSHPRDFLQWQQLSKRLENDFDYCVDQGSAIIRYHDQKVDEMIDTLTQWKEVGGYTIPVVNCPYSFGSDVGHKLLQRYPEAPFAGYYLYRNDGEEQWGLRGRDTDDFDVSEIAKLYGGGGHKKASGFSMNKRTR